MSSIQSLERALDILTLMCKNGGKMGISNIARIMNLHKSTVYRTLHTLNIKDFLRKDEKTGLYLLSNSAVMMGFMAASNTPIIRIAHPHMAYLSEKYEEYVSLAVFQEGNIFLTNYFLGNYSTTFFSSTNRNRVSIPYRPAITYCVLAYNSTLQTDDSLLIDYVNYLSKRHNKKRNLRTVEEVIERLKEVKDEGYAYEDEEYHKGELCYAVPIFDKSGKVYTILNISGAKSWLANFSKEELIEELKSVAKAISEQLIRYDIEN